MVRENDAFLDNYYKLRGWDNRGVPAADTLKKMGMTPVAADMPK
jgi:aldehyde:ferredoxin oxidoreductase